MTDLFSKDDKTDLWDLFHIHDISKIGTVHAVISTAEANKQSVKELFEELFKRYNIRQFPDREAAVKNLSGAVPDASAADVDAALRRAEINGLTEGDAFASLKSKYTPTTMNANSTRVSNQPTQKSADDSTLLSDIIDSLKHIEVASFDTLSRPSSAAAVQEVDDTNKCKRVVQLSTTITKANMDEVIKNEVHDWLCDVLGDTYGVQLQNSNHTNFVDVLRDGVLLHVLLQKLESPPVADDMLKLPRRSTGFYGRDNVASFLLEAKKRYNLLDALLFSDTDLCDSKDDRQVITCLMSIARIAYTRGATIFAPTIVKFEREIELGSSKFTKEDLERMIAEAEAEDTNPVAGSPAAPITKMQPSPPTKLEGSLLNTGRVASMITIMERRHEEERADVEKGSSIYYSRALYGNDNTSRGEESLPLSADTTAMQASVPADTECAEENGGIPRESEEEVFSSTKERASSAPHSNEESHGHEVDSVSITSENENTEVNNGNDGDDHNQGVAPAEDDTTANQEEELTPPHVARPPLLPSQDLTTSADHNGSAKAGEQRIFYLRNGVHSKDTAVDASPAAPAGAPRNLNVIWKERPGGSLAMECAPRYVSKHWDGIDLVLGRFVNEHFEKYPKSQWRFRCVMSKAGEYILYNRQTAEKRIVYVRIIQRQLFMRKSQGSGGPSWMDFREALESLEHGECL